MATPYLISGSILGSDHLALGEAIRAMDDAGVDLLQIDVADGHFTPTISFGEELVRRARAVWRRPLEVHLMVSRPQDWFALMADAGADVLLFHVETADRVHALVEQARSHVPKVGVVLNTETSHEAVRYLLPHVDLVMLMAIPPGFAGQRFVSNTLDKLAAIRELIQSSDLAKRPLLSVDGGVTLDNVGDATAAGADIVVAASALTASGDVADACGSLRQAIEHRVGDDGRGWVGEYLAEFAQVDRV